MQFLMKILQDLSYLLAIEHKLAAQTCKNNGWNVGKKMTKKLALNI